MTRILLFSLFLVCYSTLRSQTPFTPSDAFLKWDAISNQSNKAQVVRVQIEDGSTEILLPEGTYQNLTLDDEAAFLAYQVAIRKRPVTTAVRAPATSGSCNH